MKIRVSFAVQAHPSRAAHAEALAEVLGGDIVYDPDPENEIQSPWRTFRALLESTPPGFTHRLQIQDDATACLGFRDAIHRAVAARPDRLIVPCVLGRPSHYAADVRAACARDEAWTPLRLGSWCPVICTVWPVAMIAELLTFVDAQNWHDKYSADDEIVGRFLADSGVPALATVPSLVEHLDVIGSIRNRFRARAGADAGRVAACYIGDCGDCVNEIDWT